MNIAFIEIQSVKYYSHESLITNRELVVWVLCFVYHSS